MLGVKGKGQSSCPQGVLSFTVEELDKDTEKNKCRVRNKLRGLNLSINQPSEAPRKAYRK